mmetsp:Transcript_5561/g.20253  ORF Transcript_5561/g.20253 Transcript_5561/m.20253 type:complete len:743 (+) Transcript_5561:73-2301(+)
MRHRAAAGTAAAGAAEEVDRREEFVPTVRWLDADVEEQGGAGRASDGAALAAEGKREDSRARARPSPHAATQQREDPPHAHEQVGNRTSPEAVDDVDGDEDSPAAVAAAAAARAQDLPEDLHPRLRRKLKSMGVDRMFPVQAEVWHEWFRHSRNVDAVLSRLVPEPASRVGSLDTRRGKLSGRTDRKRKASEDDSGDDSGSQHTSVTSRTRIVVPTHDLLVHSPTGSGKTLAYTLPLLQSLSARHVKRLRAIVVLPTRELAVQVCEQAIRPLAQAVGLDCALLCGQTSFEREAAQLRPPPAMDDLDIHVLSGIIPGPSAVLDVLPMDPSSLQVSGSGHSSLGYATEAHHAGNGQYLQSMLQGESGADVCVVTPGRLMQHLQHGTLDVRNLQFLIVDEADRLLRQSYQEWLPRLLDAADHQHENAHDLLSREVKSRNGPLGLNFRCSGLDRSSRPERGWQTGPFMRVCKLATSATITKDPTKLEKLRLRAPKFINSEQLDIQTFDEQAHKRYLARKEKKYKLPPTLEEWKILCDEEHKAAYMVGLLAKLAGDASERGEGSNQQTIVFASSVSAAHRLRVLLQCLPKKPFAVAECSSLQSASERAKAIAEFREQKVQVLVASDVATRGLDIPSVTNIVNYDAPIYVKTYVHRAGRTARAGKRGSVYTLLSWKQAHHFGIMHAKVGSKQCQQLDLDSEIVEGLQADMTQAMRSLQQQLLNEARVGMRNQNSSDKRAEDRQQSLQK